MAKKFTDVMNEEPQRRQVEVELLTLSGISLKKILEGTTVREFKEANGLINSKLINAETRTILGDNEVLSDGMTLTVSAAKQNA